MNSNDAKAVGNMLLESFCAVLQSRMLPHTVGFFEISVLG